MARFRLVSVNRVKLEVPPSWRRTIPPAFMFKVVAVLVRLAATVGWKMLRVPPFKVMVAAPKGVAVLEANTPPPLMVSALVVDAPAVASSVPRPVLTKVPLLTPVVVNVAPAATSTAPLARTRLRVVAKESVIQNAAGTVAEAPARVTATLKVVSPSAPSEPAPSTPALMVTEATGLVPLSTRVPIPFLLIAPAPLITLEAPWVSASPAPMSNTPVPLSR